MRCTATSLQLDIPDSHLCEVPSVGRPHTIGFMTAESQMLLWWMTSLAWEYPHPAVCKKYNLSLMRQRCVCPLCVSVCIYSLSLSWSHLLIMVITLKIPEWDTALDVAWNAAACYPQSFNRFFWNHCATWTANKSIWSFLFLYHLLLVKDQIVVVNLLKDQICVALLVCPVLCGSQSAEAEQVRLQDNVSCPWEKTGKSRQFIQSISFWSCIDHGADHSPWFRSRRDWWLSRIIFTANVLLHFLGKFETLVF